MSDRPLAIRRAAGCLFVCTHHCPSQSVSLTIVPQHTFVATEPSKVQMKQLASETKDSTEMSRPRSRSPCHYRHYDERLPYIPPLHLQTPVHVHLQAAGTQTTHFLTSQPTLPPSNQTNLSFKTPNANAQNKSRCAPSTPQTCLAPFTFATPAAATKA